MRNDFAIFILTHGRADKVYTAKTLERLGYSGALFFVVDNEDSMIPEYQKRFGHEKVIVFDKQAAYDRTDTMDTFNEHNAIVYARNETFRIARSKGFKFFLMLDDDYVDFEYRWSNGERLLRRSFPDLEGLIEAMVEFLEVSGATAVALAQGGDLIGGKDNPNRKKMLLRKAMNSWFCKTDKPIEFRGTMNEDTVTYTTLGSRGALFFTYMGAVVDQRPTQSITGGMTEVYKDNGTYAKSFYAVMSMPSAVKVSVMRSAHVRIHHEVKWDYCVPKILNESYRKGNR